jgi:hypothetical protein
MDDEASCITCMQGLKQKNQLVVIMKYATNWHDTMLTVLKDISIWSIFKWPCMQLACTMNTEISEYISIYVSCHFAI